MEMRSALVQPRLLRKVVQYRWLVYELVLRDLRLRYRGSILGFAWTVLNPLLFAAVYLLIFGVFLKVGVTNYGLYLLCGLLPWNWFAGAAQQGTTAIVDGRSYVGKTLFPSEILVIVPLISYAINFVFSLPLLVIAMLIFHVPPGWGLLALPLVIVTQAISTLAVLFFLATFNVFYRDFQQLVGYVLLVLFYLVPIVYPTQSIPAQLQAPLLSEPFAIIVGAYQDMFYRGRMPDLGALGFACLAGLVLLAAAYAIFEHNKESMGEYL